MLKSPNGIERDLEYRIRFLGGLAAVLLFMILVIRFWPVEEKRIPEAQEVVFQEHVLIDDVEITRQPSTPPAPFKPDMPQPEPVDEVVEIEFEYDRDLALIDFPDLPAEQGTGLEGDEDRIVADPQLPPSVVRIVEPSVPELPAELRGRIEMVVNFLVNRDGSVEEANIIEIRKYSDQSRDEYEVLPFIQYGLMGSTLEAALNWRFRAARHEGVGVRTYTTATFNY